MAIRISGVSGMSDKCFMKNPEAIPNDTNVVWALVKIKAANQKLAGIFFEE